MKSHSHEDYVARVSAGDWPENRIVPLPESFVDGRGSIQNVLLTPVNSVVVIDSKKGTVRANHYHKTDWHFCYVVCGQILYYERPVGSGGLADTREVEGRFCSSNEESVNSIAPLVLDPGTLFFTPPDVEHAMVFTEDTVFLTLSRNVRTHEGHEEDLVRVDFISPEVASLLAGV